MRHSSARPQDIYSLTWAMVNWDDRMWVLDHHKGSRTEKESKPRVIGMAQWFENLLRKRVKSFGQTGYVFLNGDGRPWTKGAPGSECDDYGNKQELGRTSTEKSSCSIQAGIPS